MDILPASILDLGPLHRIEHICFERDAWPLIDLMAVLTFPGVIRLKGVADGRMIGFVAGDQRNSRHFSWIATIAILPEYQHHGYGLALLRACEEGLHTPRVRLCVRSDNGSAIRLYERAGYQRIDLWQNYYKDRSDALVMEKSVG